MNTYITWFKSHERLVLLLALLGFGFFAVNKGYDLVIKHDQAQADMSKQQANAAAIKAEQDDERSLALLAQLKTLQDQVTATNLRVDQAMHERAAATVVQKQKDANATSSELAARIQQLVGVGHIDVQTEAAPNSDKLVFSNDAAHATADNLEDLQQLRLDVIDLNTKNQACTALTSKQGETITSLNTQVADDKTALAKEQKSHSDDVNLLEQKRKKAWLNGFKWGAITGFLGSLFVHKP